MVAPFPLAVAVPNDEFDVLADTTRLLTGESTSVIVKVSVTGRFAGVLVSTNPTSTGGWFT